MTTLQDITDERRVSDRPRLLVVDDEESIVLTISEVLRREGYEVDVALSGAESAERLRVCDYDLVLTDLHMENGDGISVLGEVQQRSPSTMTVVLTGFPTAESAIAALRHGAYDFLVKPCDIDALKFSVRRAIEHRRLVLAEQEARASLEKLNRELEQRVEERTAELRRLNRDLAEANRAKDIFLATLSHELRTPLTPVLGWVNLLRTGGKSLDPALMTQGLDAIERNARLQARLIDDLLDISRIVSGKLRVEVEPVDLCGAARAAVETVREKAQERRIELTVELPECPLIVQGAALRLQQIVWNLLTNAIKFTPEGGRVRLRAFQEGGEARVIVEDSGIGIEPELLSQVFVPFWQVDGSTTRAYGGLGLGLSIVRALVELHGGWVRAESEGKGRGTRFIFGLLVASDASQTPEAQTVPAPQGNRMPVLVVEDSSETLEVLQVLFAHKGYSVMGANSAAEALKLAGERAPGVIISDISMPELNGYELLAELRKLPGIAGVPAIALSGYASDEDRERAIAAGFAVHLAKPIDPDHLFTVIQQLTAK